MTTYEERKVMLNEILEHKLIEPAEALKTIYHWWRFELALVRRDRANKIAIKHGKRLDEQIEVLGFRAEMRDL